MDREQIGRLLAEAHRLTNHREFVIVGSLSVLGRIANPPQGMLYSIDVDMYLRQDPARTDEIAHELGQGSAFEQENGFYADPIRPTVPALPEGWESRLSQIDYPDGVVGYYLDPNDAAVSKYARLEGRDRRWIRQGLLAEVLDADVIEHGMKTAPFLDNDEARKAREALEEDRAWLKRERKF